MEEFPEPRASRGPTSWRRRGWLLAPAAVAIVAVAVVAVSLPGPRPTPAPQVSAEATVPPATLAPTTEPVPTPLLTPPATLSPTEPAPPPVVVPEFPCGEADPSCATQSVLSRTGVPYTQPVACGPALVACQMMYDVFWPPEGSGLPVVVMVPGGPLPPGNRHSMWALARYVAARGAVVFVAEYRSSAAYGGGYPATFGDVGCAIDVARVQAGEFGGSGRRVTLVAHSFGGFPAAVAATTPDGVTIPECVQARRNPRPDALVGIAAVYLPEHIGEAFAAELLGGSREERPEAWNAVDASRLAPRADPIPVALLTGTDDLVGRSEHVDGLVAALSAWPTQVNVAVVPAANHDTILVAPATVDTVVAVAAPP